MRKKPATSVNNLFPILSILEKNGLDINMFLAEFDLDSAIRLYPDRRIPTDTLISITRKAADLTGDKYAGLHLGEIFSGFSNILGHVLLNCANAGEAFNKFRRYQRIIDEGKTLEIAIRDNMVLLEFRSEYPQYLNDIHFMDHFMSAAVTYFKILTGKKLNIGESFFIHDKPASTAEYERVFSSKLNFNSSINAIVFKSSDLLVPVLQPNRELLAVLEKYANEVLQKLSQNDSYSNRVRKLIIDMIRAENPSIETIASMLNMSAHFYPHFMVILFCVSCNNPYPDLIAPLPRVTSADIL